MRDLIVWAGACIVLAAGRAGAMESKFSGTFRTAGMVVELREGAGGYTGAVKKGDQVFPLEAREAPGSVEGSFEFQGARFPFRATLEGDTLTFTTGATTYRLERAAAERPKPSNPLDPPAGGAAPPAVKSPTAKAAAQAPGSRDVLRFVPHSVKDRDDMIGGEALSFLVPAGWKVEGGIHWRLHPTMPATVALRASAPEGVDAMEFFPTLPFSWGGYLGPGTAFPPGSNYLGNEVQPPVADFRECIRKLVMPRFRAGVRAPRVVKEEELPKLAEAVRAENPPQGGMAPVVSAGRVRIEYAEGGTDIEEDLYCALITIDVPLGLGRMTIWIADKLTSMRAEKGKLDDGTRILQTAVTSTRLNIEWLNRYAQLVRALTQAQMQQIRSAGELSRAISRTSSEISDMMRRSYEERMASQDRIGDGFSQYVRGVEAYRDPRDDRRVELPSGYTNAWVNSRGEYVVAEGDLFDPNVELDGQWTKLEKPR